MKRWMPLHVTMKVLRGCPSLRSERAWRVLRAALRDGRERPGFRIVVFSVQVDHLHLVTEVHGVHGLEQGLRSLAIRIAMRLNRAWRRRVRVFADRYHARALRTPHEVRHALAYVLLNARKHGILLRGIDPRSSGAWFDGWKHATGCPGPGEPPVAPPTTWLLREGWRRHGPIGLDEVPGVPTSSRRGAQSGERRAVARRRGTSR